MPGVESMRVPSTKLSVVLQVEALTVLTPPSNDVRQYALSIASQEAHLSHDV